MFVMLDTPLFIQTCRTHLFGMCSTCSFYLAQRTCPVQHVLHARSQPVLILPLLNTKGCLSGHSLGVWHPTHPPNIKNAPFWWALSMFGPTSGPEYSHK